MKKNTLDGFCRHLLDEDLSGIGPDPEAMAARFVDYFGLSARPSLEELTVLAQRAEFGTVREEKMDGLKGAHVGQPGVNTTSTTGRTCGRAPRPRRCSTSCTRSSWRAWLKCTPMTPWTGACARKPTVSRRRR